MMFTVELCALLERTHLFNGPFSGTTRVSWYQKDKTNLDFTESRDSDWQWHQLDQQQQHNNNERLTAFDPGQPG